jgi:hypothetical protein
LLKELLRLRLEVCVLLRMSTNVTLSSPVGRNRRLWTSTQAVVGRGVEDRNGHQDDQPARRQQ